MYKYLVLVFYYAFLTAWLLMEILDYFKLSRIQMLLLRIYWTSMAREPCSSSFSFLSQFPVIKAMKSNYLYDSDVYMVEMYIGIQ